jgi:uncharacterized peroxidase-related enzyme
VDGHDTKPKAGQGLSSSLNLPVVEESAADGEVARVYERYRSHFNRDHVPGILKCFATHPPLLRSMMDLAENMLFVDGDLVRRHKEMIATLVSCQNACPYCADSHGYQFRMQGGSAESLCAIQENHLDTVSLTAAERALAQFAEKVNRSSHQVVREDVETLMQAGWSERQIAEAVHIVALFAAFNRVVNAFGVPSQGLLAGYQADASGDGSSSTK